MIQGNAGATSDHEILEQIAARSRAAVSELYDRYSRLLYGVILGVVRDTDDAEDILQEVFVQVWRSAVTFNPALGSPRTWLVRMAHNRSIDLLRSRRWRNRQHEVRASSDDGESPTLSSSIADTTWATAVRNEQATYISSALSRLPAEQSALIDLAFLQGFTHTEIARRTGIPLGTVKTRIRNGMLQLRTQLRSYAEEG